MRTGVMMGEAQPFVLKHALMVFGPEHESEFSNRTAGAYVTLHDVEIPKKKGAPRLGPGRPADLGFLRGLSASLQATVPLEHLPTHVLYRTPDTIVWWSGAQVRPMFFTEESDLGEVSGKAFPHPALVWKIVGQHIYVRALGTDQRPDPGAQLYHAPYWNTNPDGRICLGSMKRPGEVSISSLRGWEDGYFGSLFTGQNMGGNRAKGGLVKTWTRLADRKTFPKGLLVDVGETLEKFAGGADA